MKIAANIGAALLGLAFVAFGLMYLLGLVPEQPAPPQDSAVAHFMAAFAPTGYLAFVKVLEVVGGLLVAMPPTRRAGLLVLGPILINILAFHVYVTEGEGVFSPVLMLLCALTLFLVWIERSAFARFVVRRNEQLP